MNNIKGWHVSQYMLVWHVKEPSLHNGDESRVCLKLCSPSAVSSFKYKTKCDMYNVNANIYSPAINSDVLTTWVEKKSINHLSPAFSTSALWFFPFFMFDNKSTKYTYTYLYTLVIQVKTHSIWVHTLEFFSVHVVKRLKYDVFSVVSKLLNSNM